MAPMNMRLRPRPRVLRQRHGARGVVRPAKCNLTSSVKHKVERSVRNPDVVRNTKMKCAFCKKDTVDEVNFGVLKSVGNIPVHYYCVLLSSTIKQSGKDNQGLLGFTKKDIADELAKTKKMKCCFCGKQHANLKCKSKKCSKRFHLPCGLQEYTLHVFDGKFESFCFDHRPDIHLPERVECEDCVICLEKIPDETYLVDLYFPKCCGKAIMHIYCAKKLALNSGYFTKCPVCNDATVFCKDLQKNGVFVPKQDATWELEAGAFSELLEPYSQCDADPCICRNPLKNKYSVNRKNSLWRIIRCRFCGNSGIHKKCNNMRLFYECQICTTVLEKVKKGDEHPEDNNPKQDNNVVIEINDEEEEEQQPKESKKVQFWQIVNVIEYTPTETTFDTMFLNDMYYSYDSHSNMNEYGRAAKAKYQWN